MGRSGDCTCWITQIPRRSGVSGNAETGQCGGWTAVAAALIGLTTNSILVVTVASVILVFALVAIMSISVLTGPATNHFKALRSRCASAESRLHSCPMDSEDTKTVHEMITCDEGTLAYCAAKIASEIEQEPAWDVDAVGFVAIDLWDELAEVGASARQIAQDRKVTQALESGRLRDDPEVRAVIEEDKQLRKDAIALLAARVHAFADYRDRVHCHGMATLRDRNTLGRMVRLASDEQAIIRLR